jgi:hypothetical protein
MTTFRNDQQRAQACRTLLSFSNLEGFFNADGRPGPTDLASELLSCLKRDGPSMLSQGEQILFLAAFDFWNGAGGASIWQIQSHLNVNVIHAIGELLIACNEEPALAGDPVDQWIERWKRYRVVDTPNGSTVR